MKYCPVLQKLAAAILLICFFLPLSECTYRIPDDVEKTKIAYPYEMMATGIAELKQEGGIRNVAFLFSIIVLFFLPIVLVWTKSVANSIALLLGSVFSLYELYFHAMVRTPKIGAMLAISSWLVLLICSLMTLREQFLITRACNGPS